MNTVKSEDTPAYGPETDFVTATIDKALRMLQQRLKYPSQCMSSPSTVKDFVRLKLAELEHEVFSVLWLDAQNRLLEYQEMFRGTLTQTSVYPREVVKAGLAINAAAVILVHNHPSGEPQPSRADELLTDELKRALALVDIKVLDHIVVGGMDTVSFAERGLV
jgi:DNA repair protein RadC